MDEGSNQEVKRGGWGSGSLAELLLGFAFLIFYFFLLKSTFPCTAVLYLAQAYIFDVVTKTISDFLASGHK